MISARVNSIDPYSGFLELEVCSIHSLMSNRSNFFSSLTPDISVTQNIEFFSFQLKGKNKRRNMLPDN